MITKRSDLVGLARVTAAARGLDPVLICAIVERESTWNPHAVRLENGFYHIYMVPMVEKGIVSVSEAVLRSTSFGLGQTMLESLREIGFAGTPEELLLPVTSLEWLCHLFAKKLAAAAGDVRAALLRWNGGKNQQYDDDVFALMEHYR